MGAVRTTQSSISLVEGTSKPLDLEYMALSHCWGSKPLLTLTQTSVERLKKSILISELPKTSQDAVIVAATWFHCDYLWINSLCIIQDSAVDWRKESVGMRGIELVYWEGEMPKVTFRVFSSDVWTDGVSRARLIRKSVGCPRALLGQTQPSLRIRVPFL